MEKTVRRDNANGALLSTVATVIGDIVITFAGNRLYVRLPENTPVVECDTFADAEKLASDYAGPWHIDGVDGYFPTLAEAAQHAELMVGTAGEFARRVMVRDKWQRVAYVAKGGEA